MDVTCYRRRSKKKKNNLKSGAPMELNTDGINKFIQKQGNCFYIIIETIRIIIL